MMQKETLYIVSTPIGNLQDITFRALEILKACDILVCEDTRVTQKLLNHYNIKANKLVSYASHNLKAMTERIVNDIKAGQKVALVTDAGTPLISDPGELLVEMCYSNNIKVTHIPGASAIISALVVAGLSTEQFFFGGFLPQKLKARQLELKKAQQIPCTLIFFESKHRILSSLQDILSVFGASQQVVLVRELTKLYEEVIRGTIEEIIKQIVTRTMLGEFIVLIKKNEIEEVYSEVEVQAAIKQELANNSVKDASKIIAEKYKLNKSEVYNMAVTIKNEIK